MKFPELSRTQICGLISEWIHNKRNREIMELRLCDGMTYDELAEKFKMSVPQIKNIVYKSQDIIFRHI